MNRAELLAQADAADREADRIFERIDAKRGTLPADYMGRRPLIPEGCDAEAQRASDLRREARHLRAEVDEMTPAVQPTPRPGAHSASVPPPLMNSPSPAAGLPSKPKQEPAVDPVEAAVARIMAA